MQSLRQAGIRFPVLIAFRLLFACLTILPSCLLYCSRANASLVSPYRAFYQDVDVISTVELYERLFTVALIDVRSRFEFDVVRINRSISLPLGDRQFSSRLEKLTVPGENVVVVFVGNYLDCPRPFEAAWIARTIGLRNVYVYDAGISSWLHAYLLKGDCWVNWRESGMPTRGRWFPPSRNLYYRGGAVG